MRMGHSLHHLRYALHLLGEGSDLPLPLFLLVNAVNSTIINHKIDQIIAIGITFIKFNPSASANASEKEILFPDSICCINSSIIILALQIESDITNINK